MKVFITTPAINGIHGGLRVINTWANLLAEYHEVYLYSLKSENSCNWMKLSPKVQICGFNKFIECDCVILTSPHSVHLIDIILPHQKCFLFLQMQEDMFVPNDANWFAQCKKFYTAPYPMFSISKWNMERMEKTFGRTGTTYYIRNGIDFNEFPISEKPKDGKTVLIEGYEPGSNPTKDVNRLGAKVGARLRKEGYRVLAYSQSACTMKQGVDEYYQKPPLPKLNELYERATILIKASLYDARSLSPLEAMTKGTSTARAIVQGDDDVIHEYNGLRCEYNEEQLYQTAKRLLTDNDLRGELSFNCKQYVQTECNWDKIMNEINEILCR